MSFTTPDPIPALLAHRRLASMLPRHVIRGPLSIREPAGRRGPNGQPPLCQDCGTTDPTRFYPGQKRRCSICKNRRGWLAKKSKQRPAFGYTEARAS